MNVLTMLNTDRITIAAILAYIPVSIKRSLRAFICGLWCAALVTLPTIGGEASAQTTKPALARFTRVAPEVYPLCSPARSNCRVRVYRTPPTPREPEVHLVVIELPYERTQFSTRGGPMQSGRLRDIYMARARPQDLVVTSANFVRTNPTTDRYEPNGLLVVEGTKVSDMRQWRSQRTGRPQGGVVFERGRGMEIETTAAFQLSPNIVSAVQGNPILVENGRNADVREASYLHNRIAIGRSQSGALVLAGIFGRGDDPAPVSQKDWADLLAAPQEAGGLSLALALGLEGGPPAYIYVRPLNLHFGMNPEAPVPSTIHLSLGAF